MKNNKSVEKKKKDFIRKIIRKNPQVQFVEN